MTKQRKDIHQEVTDKIVAELERGTVPWVRPWSVTGAALPRNAVSGKPYNGVNILMLWGSADYQGFECGNWLTFKQAKDYGGNVRKGEKGTHIVWAQPFEKTKKSESGATQRDENGNPLKDRFMMMKAYTVFNALQCDGLPGGIATTSKAIEKPVADRSERIEQWIGDIGADVRHGGDRAYYMPSDDHIQMPNIERFENAGHYYATSLHEHTHWTGSPGRLARDKKGNRFGNAGYAREELVAEMGAAFLCAELGVQARLQHASYLASWTKVLKEDKRAIFTAASQASKAAQYLGSCVEKNTAQAIVNRHNSIRTAA